MRTKILRETNGVNSPDLIRLEKEAAHKLDELEELMRSQKSKLREKLKKFKEWVAAQRDYILEFNAHNGRWPKGVAENTSKKAYSIASRIWECSQYLEEPKHCNKCVEHVDKLTAYYNWATRCQRQLDKNGVKKPAETEQKAALSKRQRIWIRIKKIPHWIYYILGAFAALLTILHLLGWLEPIKNLFTGY